MVSPENGAPRIVEQGGAEALGAQDLGRLSLRLLGRDQLPTVEADPVGPESFDTDIADIYTNTRCNGAGTTETPDLCKICFLSTPQLKSEHMIDPDAFDHIVGWLTREESPFKRVTLLGGEFALHPQAKSMIRKVSDAGLGLRIVTSGSREFQALLEDDEVVDTLRDPDDRGNLVAVSLDSYIPWRNDSQRGKGAFDLATTTMDKLREKDVAFRVNTTITRLTMGPLLPLAKLVEAKGAQALLVHAFSPIGRGAMLGKVTTNINGVELYWSRSSDPKVAPFMPEAISEALEPYEWAAIRRLPEMHRTHSKKNPDFSIEVEQGFAPETHCALRQPRKVNLQFMPPGRVGKYLPVVSCGMFAPKADRMSGYLFDPYSGELYTRAGESELTLAERSTAGCPARPDSPDFACIYDRVSDQTKNHSAAE